MSLAICRIQPWKTDTTLSKNVSWEMFRSNFCNICWDQYFAGLLVFPVWTECVSSNLFFSTTLIFCFSNFWISLDIVLETKERKRNLSNLKFLHSFLKIFLHIYLSSSCLFFMSFFSSTFPVSSYPMFCIQSPFRFTFFSNFSSKLTDLFYHYLL